MPTLEQKVEASGTGVTSINLPSWTPGSNELVLVSVAISGNKTATVTGNGLTFTMITSLNSGGTNGVTISVYRAMGASPTTGQITVDQGSTSAICASATRWSDVDTGGTGGADAIEDFDTASGSSGSPTVTTTPVSDDTVVWGAFAYEEGDFTVGSGYTSSTLDLQGGAGSFITRLATEYKTVATAAATVVDGTIDETDSWAVCGLVIKPPPAAGGSTPYYYASLIGQV